MNRKVFLTVMLIAVVLGLGTAQARACRFFKHEDIVITDFDPSDDIHGMQAAAQGGK